MPGRGRTSDMTERASPPETRSATGDDHGWLLLVLAFAGGITSLGLEICAARLLAPFFGASTYIWGAIIGLVLLYLSAGYYLGGWAGDRWPQPRVLYRLAAIASALVLLIPLVSRPVLLVSESLLDSQGVGAFVGALIAVILLFAPAVITLGMISPYVIRLKVDSVAGAGRTAGLVYSLSTAGSILGAFLPAFWWIPTFGTRATIYGLGLLLLVVSIGGMATVGAHRTKSTASLCLLPLVGLVIPFSGIRPVHGGSLITEAETEYGYVQVVQSGSERQMIVNEGYTESSVYDPGQVLTRRYWDYFTLAPMYAHANWAGQKPERVLIIGLAGGTSARQLTAAYGAIPIDGVEIDPKVVDLGRQYFGMTEPNLRVIVSDGRYALAHEQQRYDLILVDAYFRHYIPFHLTTREFFAACRDRLTPHGVVAVNVANQRLMPGITGTMRDVFPGVQQETVPGTANHVVFGALAPIGLGEVQANLSHDEHAYSDVLGAVVQQSHYSEISEVTPHAPVWTDDLDPAERVIDSLTYK